MTIYLLVPSRDPPCPVHPPTSAHLISLIWWNTCKFRLKPKLHLRTKAFSNVWVALMGSIYFSTALILFVSLFQFCVYILLIYIYHMPYCSVMTPTQPFKWKLWGEEWNFCTNIPVRKENWPEQKSIISAALIFFGSVGTVWFQPVGAHTACLTNWR